MSLRFRILAVALGTLVLALVAGYLLASRSLLTGYQNLEETLVRGRMQTVEGVMLDSLRSLGKTAHLMSLAQPDTRQLWSPDQLYAINVDAMALIAPDGRIMSGAAASGDFSAWGAELLPYLVSGSPLLERAIFSPAMNYSAGVLRLPSGPVLLAWAPLNLNDRSSPLLLVLTRLEAGDIEEAAGLPGLSLSVTPLDYGKATRELELARQAIANGDAVAVEPVNENTVQSYALLGDIYGEPAALLTGVFDRDLFNQGRSGRNQLLWAMLLSWLMLAAALIFFLNHYGLARLERLSREVARVREGGDPGRRVASYGTDELGGLAHGINKMLAALEKAQAGRMRSEGRYRVVIDQMSEGVVIIDPQTGRSLAVNPALERLLGYEAGALAGETVYNHMLIPTELAQQVIASVAATHKPLRSRIPLRLSNGESLEVEVSLAKVDWDEQIAVCALIHDIRERIRFEAELRHRAYHDVLTGLPNRFSLVTRLDEALLEAERTGEIFALMFIDLNRFKDVNDTLGHAAGDELLREIARRLTLVLRAQDTVARMGGDEFCLVLRDAGDPRRVAAVAERLLDAISEPIWLEATAEFYPSASIGIAIYPRDGRTADELMRRSDQAMYQAKASQGSSQAIFYSESLARPRSSRELALNQGLPGAIERGEMVLYYQPIIDLASKRLVATEALLRWNHPEFGLLAPAEFLYLAEDNGTGPVIGDWVLREALTQNRHWQAAGYAPVRMAVNISVLQFRWPGFTRAVAKVLSQVGVAPEYLELEITESVLGQATEAGLREISALRRRGVKVVLDEFGNGFTSFTRLPILPLDGVKISWDLVRALDLETSAAGFGQGVLSLIARRTAAFNLYCVAVGIETEEQYLAARRAGCRDGQGYLFGGPVPGELLENLVRAGAVD